MRRVFPSSDQLRPCTWGLRFINTFSSTEIFLLIVCGGGGGGGGATISTCATGGGGGGGVIENSWAGGRGGGGGAFFSVCWAITKPVVNRTAARDKNVFFIIGFVMRCGNDFIP
jgi:hypothetical protein